MRVAGWFMFSKDKIVMGNDSITRSGLAIYSSVHILVDPANIFYKNL